jgi:D-tyrosyl-tRNA(Tyr) deacylase
MRAVVQRVEDASVTVAGRSTGRIDHGLLVYLGIGIDDTGEDLDYLVDKVVHLRIYADQEGKMNLSLLEAGAGGVLVISQFTLYGDVRKGRRPSYSDAAPPQKAEALYHDFIAKLKNRGLHVEGGVFQAMMDVKSTNKGPVTILLDSKKIF